MPGSFKSAYLKLNADQKKAVDYIEGPLLVVAGPGTGKTQLLSLRAANILTKTDCLPENILCLTFTESGVEAMRSRLTEVIGPDAYKLTISTYHSFGREIIRHYPRFFPTQQNSRPINELRINATARSIQANLPFDHELKSPELTASLVGIISDFKQALLTPKDLEAIAQDNLEFIELMSKVTRPLSESLRRVSKASTTTFETLLKTPPDHKLPHGTESLSSLWQEDLRKAIDQSLETNKTTSLSKWKLKYLVKDSEDNYVPKGEVQNQRLVELAKFYAAYLKELKAEELVDYDDLILLTIEALKKFDELRFNLQEKYMYIMLDEYQDTNEAQAELVYLLTNNPSSEGRPNAMAVGDDDQAIYAFQGARHSNMLDFTKQYKDVNKISLKLNYRSNQAIIDLSSQVSGQIGEGLTSLLENLDKDFIAAKTGQARINNLGFNNELDSYDWLAKELKSAKGSVAVISPKHKYLERAAAYLNSANLPVSYDRRENILDDLLIDQIITILRLVKAIADQNHNLADQLLPTILNYDFFKLPTQVVWQLSWRAHEEHQPLLNVMLKNASTKNVALFFMKLAASSLSQRFDVLIDQIIGLSEVSVNDEDGKIRSPFYAFYKLDGNDLQAAKLFQNLNVLSDQFKDYLEGNFKPLGLGALLDFIDELKQSGLKLTNNFGLSQGDQHIQLMTVHGSKGLEFDQVYLLALNNDTWGPKGRFSRLGLPPNLAFINYLANDADDEALRLLYVAISRARSSVTTLSFDHDASLKASLPIKYLKLEPVRANTKQPTNPRPLWEVSKTVPILNSELKTLIKTRLNNYSLNPSALNTFLDIRNAGPEIFFKSVVLKYRQPIGPRVDYGSAMHGALDWLQRTLTETKTLPSLNKLLHQFELLLQKRRLLDSDFKQLLEQGQRSLSAYYQANKSNFSPENISEYSFAGEGLSLGNIRLTGKIDKLELSKKTKTMTIVDYKTGRGYPRWENKPKLHLYKLQLYFYKLLAEKSPEFKTYKLDGARLDFIEPHPLTHDLYEIPLAYSPAEAEHFQKLLKAVWRHIEDVNFPNVNKYPPTLKGMLKFEDDLINGKI